MDAIMIVGGEVREVAMNDRHKANVALSMDNGTAIQLFGVLVSDAAKLRIGERVEIVLRKEEK